MKKILLIVLVLIVGCAKEPEPINTETLNEIFEDGKGKGDFFFHTKDTNEPYTGAVFSLYTSGEKKFEGYLKNGKIGGKVTWYHENGQIRTEGYLKDGKPDGKWTDYWRNGQIEYDRNYKDGELDGKWTYYNEDGSIDRVDEWKNGVKVDK